MAVVTPRDQGGCNSFTNSGFFEELKSDERVYSSIEEASASLFKRGPIMALSEADSLLHGDHKK